MYHTLVLIVIPLHDSIRNVRLHKIAHTSFIAVEVGMAKVASERIEVNIAVGIIHLKVLATSHTILAISIFELQIS